MSGLNSIIFFTVSLIFFLILNRFKHTCKTNISISLISYIDLTQVNLNENLQHLDTLYQIIFLSLAITVDANLSPAVHQLKQYLFHFTKINILFLLANLTLLLSKKTCCLFFTTIPFSPVALHCLNVFNPIVGKSTLKSCFFFGNFTKLLISKLFTSAFFKHFFSSCFSFYSNNFFISNYNSLAKIIFF